MGDIREFWLAIAIYVTCSATIHFGMTMTPWLNAPPAVRVVAVLGGGIVLYSVVIFLWAGVMKLFTKRKL